MSRRRFLLSGFIVGLLAIQALAAIGFFSERAWPFLAYPMYVNVHQKGEAIPQYAVVATTVTGRRLELRPDDFRYNFWQYQRGPVWALQVHRIDKLRQHIGAFERRAGVAVASVTLENRPMALVDGKVVALPVKTVSEMSLR